MITQPLFGALSDHWGRKKSMIACRLLAKIAVVPLMTALANVHSPWTAFLLITCGFAIVSLYTSISGLVQAELFPTTVRALGVGFTYGLANALFGGGVRRAAHARRAQDGSPASRHPHRAARKLTVGAIRYKRRPCRRRRVGARHAPSCGLAETRMKGGVAAV